MLRQQVAELLSQGHFARAEALCDAEIAEGSDLEAYHFKAVARTQAGRFTEAFPLFEEAHERMPKNPDVLYNYGSALQQSGDLKQALNLWRQTIILNPGDTRALYNIAAALRILGRYAEAEAAYRTVLSLDPLHGYALLDLGGLVFQNGDLATAGKIFARAIQVMPNEKEAWLNLGTTLKASREFEPAETCVRQALTLDPGYPPANAVLAKLLLLQGRWREGFAECHWRSGEISSPPGVTDVERWDGKAVLDGKRLLVWADDNLADCIAFARYVAPLQDLTPASLTLLCPAPLCGVMAGLAGVSRVLQPGAPLDSAEFDLQVPLCSLPHLLGREDPETCAGTPYIEAPFGRQSATDDRVRVGVVWAPDPRFEPDACDDLSLAKLLPLFDLDGFAWQSLQIEPDARDAECLANDPRVADRALTPRDYGEVAAALCGIDLLVSGDTAIAHLAAAMGLPVCLLLPWAGSWRWDGEAGGSAWYRSVRVYRQDEPGDWRAAVAALRRDLAAERPAVVGRVADKG